MSEELDKMGMLEEKIKRFIDADDNGKRVDISECEDFLNNIPSFTDKHTIEDTRDFLAFLGNPDENMKIIHVAGTNGKGSVCCYVTNILNAAGHSVGYPFRILHRRLQSYHCLWHTSSYFL